MPDLKQILGSLIFGAERALTVREMRKCLAEVAETDDETVKVFGEARDKEIVAALEELRQELDRGKCGFHLSEVAGGYRLQSDAECGVWLRYLLKAGRPSRLSRPSLETLAVIAYRQPVTRSEIEGIRGVSVDHVMKLLMEMQLVKIVGRSELPGRPLLYGTTHTFLEYFGLKSLDDLASHDPMLNSYRDQIKTERSRSKPAENGDGEAASGKESAAENGEDPAATAPARAESDTVDSDASLAETNTA